MCDNRFGSRVFVLSTTAFAAENVALSALGRGKQITAIGAEDERCNRSHGRGSFRDQDEGVKGG